MGFGFGFGFGFVFVLGLRLCLRLWLGLGLGLRWWWWRYVRAGQFLMNARRDCQRDYNVLSRWLTSVQDYLQKCVKGRTDVTYLTCYRCAVWVAEVLHCLIACGLNLTRIRKEPVLILKEPVWLISHSTSQNKTLGSGKSQLPEFSTWCNNYVLIRLLILLLLFSRIWGR